MMTAFVILLAAATAAVLLPAVYLLCLTVAGLFYRSSGSHRANEAAPATRFAVLVPAHNEEAILPELMASMDRQDYPRGLFDVYVVADNCSDQTAEVARKHGAVAFERHDKTLRGKGYALQWLLGKIRGNSNEYDAYLLIDADSTISTNFLGVMDARLQGGSQVVQSYYTVSNPTQTSVSALRHIALVLMHHTRPLGRKVLGLSSGLFGTGMAFRREIINAYDWDSYTLAEDVEYYLKLTERGLRIDFAPEAVVASDMPTSFKEAKSQNLRWERGRLQMARKYGIPFFFSGLLKGNLLKLDAAIEQLIPPLSLTFAAGALLLILTLFMGRTWLIGMAGAANIALVGHLFLGLVSARAPWQVYRALLFAPKFILWKLWVYSLALVPGELQWTRTERSKR